MWQRKYKRPTRISPTKMNPLYMAFVGMHERVQPNYKFAHRYFDRGITIATIWAKGKWDAFTDWAEQNGWQVGLELDRKNNNQGYAPANCRFVSHKINSANRDTAHHAAATKAGIAKRQGKQRQLWRQRQRASALKRWGKLNKQERSAYVRKHRIAS